MINHPSYWRELARHTRLVAETIKDETARIRMMDVADAYERMALREA